MLSLWLDELSSLVRPHERSCWEVSKLRGAYFYWFCCLLGIYLHRCIVLRFLSRKCREWQKGWLEQYQLADDNQIRLLSRDGTGAVASGSPWVYWLLHRSTRAVSDSPLDLIRTQPLRVQPHASGLSSTLEFIKNTNNSLPLTCTVRNAEGVECAGPCL